MEPTGAAVAVVVVAHQQQHQQQQQQQQQQLEIPPFLTKATVYAITGVGADGSNSIASSSATMSVEKEDPPALPLLVLLPPSPSPSPPAAATADDDLGHEANGYDHGHDGNDDDDDDDVSVGERWNHEVGVCAEDYHSDVSSASSNSICKSSSNSTRSSPSLSQGPRDLHSPVSPDRPDAAPWPPEGAQPSVEPSEPRGLVFVTAPTCATGPVCARSTNVVRIQIVPEEPVKPVKSPTDCNNNQHNGHEHDDSRDRADRGRVTVSQGGSNSSTAPAQVTVISFGGDDQKEEQQQQPVIDPESLLPSPPIVATDTASQPTSLISTPPGTGVTMVQRGVATGDAATVSDAVDAANFGDSPYVYYMAAAAASKVRSGSTGGGRGGGGESVVGGGSGQCSPSDTLDSGTCSDIEVTPTPPPPLPKKMSKLGGSVHISNHTSSGAVVGPAAVGGGGGRQMAIDNDNGSTNVIGRPRTADANHQPDQHQHRLGGPPSNDDDDDDDDDGGDDDDDENRRQQQQQQPPKQQKHKPYGHGTRRSTVRSRGCASDSDDSESCLSSDSLNFSDHHQQHQPPLGPPEEPTTRPPSSEHPSGTSSRKRHLLLRADGGTGAGGGILPDSLLAAIRGSRPRVYDEAKLMLLTKPTPPAPTNDGEDCDDDEHVGEGSVLLTTTRSILMDKINSLMHREGLEATRTQQSTQPHNHHPSINNNNSSGTRGPAMVATGDSVRSNQFESDRYYNFHIHERSGGDGGATGGTADGPGSRSSPETTPPSVVGGGDLNSNDDDGSFAGLKDLTSGTSTIRSNKGTVRGVKNRVRNGIATFLQMQQTTGMKNYKDKEAGKVVVYSTSMGIVRETYTKCMNVKQILRTLLIKFEEKDIFMSNEYQQEIRERMQTDCVTVPQVFVDGQHVGDAECIERLNENGELRKMLKPYKCLDSPYTCKVCGGYRLLPCPSCGGSKKSIHRNHFTAEFVALKCMNCDEVGLVKCHNC